MEKTVWFEYRQISPDEIIEDNLLDHVSNCICYIIDQDYKDYDSDSIMHKSAECVVGDDYAGVVWDDTSDVDWYRQPQMNIGILIDLLTQEIELR
ncbi:MAG: hypothetical protein JW801_18075 [Bacteroidales bacterium]|nr:hypothetical protein [Bacteroidales bacterium]